MYVKLHEQKLWLFDGQTFMGKLTKYGNEIRVFNSSGEYVTSFDTSSLLYAEQQSLNILRGIE